ncbi:MAG: response regulator transcription factor [Desulfobacteraceae bacterium]|jgi:DNA-binding NarL/FixJ family response regulator
MIENIRTLLIEDNPGDVRLIQEMLSEANPGACKITVYDRLAHAQPALERDGYDVVLLDLTLPDSTGLATLSRLRPTVATAAVIVLTGLNDEAAAIQALREGAQDYLVKDRMSPEVLWRSIRYAIERKRVELKLLARERELEDQTRDLEEVNAALRVLLKQREADKTELEERIVGNFRELVRPLLEKLKTSGLNDRQKAFVEIAENELNNILAPFLRKVSTGHLKLTPTEIQVANLVKHGKSTKEIAHLMHLSVKTVQVNRNNIRRKLGIINKKVNLRTYLLSVR